MRFLSQLLNFTGVAALGIAWSLSAYAATAKFEVTAEVVEPVILPDRKPLTDEALEGYTLTEEHLISGEALAEELGLDLQIDEINGVTIITIK